MVGEQSVVHGLAGEASEAGESCARPSPANLYLPLLGGEDAQKNRLLSVSEMCQAQGPEPAVRYKASELKHVSRLA